MAPKRPSPSDDPPSDDDQEPQHLQSQDQEAESDDPEPDESSDEEEEQQPPPNQLDDVKKTVSSSSADSGSESEPPSQPEPAQNQPLVDLHVKPISSKPIRSKPEATSLPAPKRAKKDEDGDGSASAAGGGAVSDPAAGKGRQHLFNFRRLWTAEDEIVIMKGIIDYCAAKNKAFDPSNDVDAFHEFIKHNLEIKGTRKQLVSKIRKLKLKYMNNAAKGRVFSVPHEKLTYELSTKIWGSSSGSGSGSGVSNTAVRPVDAPKSNGKAKVMPTLKKCEDVPVPKPTQNGKEKVIAVPAPAQEPSNGSQPPKEENLSESDLFRMSKGSIELDEGFVKRGIDLINHTKKLELEERWRNLQVAEMELFLRRMELVQEQTKLMLDACKKH